MNPDANPAQTPENPSGDNGSPGSSSSGSGGTPAGSQPSQEASALEVQRRERGRQEALQQRIDALTAQNQHLSSQLGGVVTKIVADEEREWEAQLARMEPAERGAAIATRALEENRALRRQLQQDRTQPSPTVDPVAYKERKSREMVEAANQRHGLTGDAAMKVDDFDEEDLVDEKTFNTALRVEARLRAQGGAVPRKKDSEDDVVNRRVQEELRKHGVSSPASAKPSSPGHSSVTEEDVQATLRNARGAPRDKVAALRALEIKVDRPGRR
jgi:hypothetical protein